MEKENTTTAEQMSSSKQKRIERANKNKKAKRSALTGKLISAVIGIIVVAGIVYLIASAAYKASLKVTPNNDFSKEINDNGYIKGVTATSCVTLPEYKGIEIPNSEIEYTDEELDAALNATLEAYKGLNTSGDVTIKDGDTVNLDYVGYVDGEEFEGGNSNGNGSDLEIGSHTFIDDFEEQLIGAKPGEFVTVEVTFPEDYSSADLAGKDATFECTINGIYELPEFNDEFVAENLSDEADSADEYIKNIKDRHYEENLNNWIEAYLRDNSTINSYPKKYLKQLKALSKYTEMESYEYMNQMYAQMYGSGYTDFYDYAGVPEEEYDVNLEDSAKETEADILIYQAIAEKEGIKYTIADYKASLVEKDGNDNSYENQAEQYGDAYLVQGLYKDMAIKLVKDNAVYVD